MNLTRTQCHVFSNSCYTDIFAATHLTQAFPSTHVTNTCLYHIYTYLQLPLWTTVPFWLDVLKARRSDCLMNQTNCGLIFCEPFRAHNVMPLFNVIAWGFYRKLRGSWRVIFYDFFDALEIFTRFLWALSGNLGSIGVCASPCFFVLLTLSQQDISNYNYYLHLQLTSHSYQPSVFWQIINFKVFTHYNSRFRELSHICGSRLSYTPNIPVSFWTFLGNRIHYSGIDDWIAFELSNGLLNSKMSETRSW